MKISESNLKNIDGKKYRIAIIASKFNQSVTDGLVRGAYAALTKKNVNEKNIKIYFVPGAFEIPLALKKICNSKSGKKFDGVITLGCVIKGETAHFEYISNTVSNSIQQISLQYHMPVGFGVLTCYTAGQAFERSVSKLPTADNNKGYESALAVLEMIGLLKKI